MRSMERALEASGGFHVWADQNFFVLAQSQVSETTHVSGDIATTSAANLKLTDFLDEDET